MGATNKTTNYELPQFIGTDTPSWLGDFNGAMSKIDTAIRNVADNTSQASQDVASMEGRLTQVETQSTNTASAVSQLTNSVQGNDTKHTNAESVLDGKIGANTTAIATANQNITGLNTRTGTVEETLGDIAGQISVGENKFFFDVQDGAYGYNTSETRGADTFHPFSEGGGEDLEPVLLWTNPSPSSVFNAQTVSLDLSEYAGVIIEFYEHTDQNKIATRVYIKKDDDLSTFGAGLYSSNYSNSISRNITGVSNAGVTFGIAHHGPSDLALYCIPFRIYGVKSYVVAVSEGELLWSNSAPASEFAPTTVSLDLSSYKSVKIVYKTYAGATDSYEVTIPKEVSNVIIGSQVVLGGANRQYCRNISSNNTGITFQGGYFHTISGTTSVNANNTSTIPLEIYGIN